MGERTQQSPPEKKAGTRLWRQFFIWCAWQLFVLFFALIVYANLFSEYGAYSHPVVDPIAAAAFLVAAIYIGTWMPIRRWRAARHASGDRVHDDSEVGRI